MTRRVLMSVSDKTGLADFARDLAGMGWEIVSTGGTARVLRENHVETREVADVTSFPEILGGRVKTLHPAIHGGLLARRDNPSDMSEVRANGIGLIDMVVCNLYKFVEATEKTGATMRDIIEEIDIGGPAMLRAAAKNWQWTIPLCDPARYEEITKELKLTGDVNEITRQSLAAQVFAHTAAYDAAVAAYLGSTWNNWPLDFPDELSFGYRRSILLRYGENPHQKAAFYEPVIGGGVSPVSSQLQGKELSYNNINDADGAYYTVWELQPPACCIVKHASPCGAAAGANAAEAFTRAFEADTTSAYGGVVAFNCEVDAEAAAAMKGIFLEVLLAPSYSEAALEVLRVKKDLRVLVAHEPPSRRYGVRSALGGLLVQEQDTLLPKDEEWQVVSRRSPTDAELHDLRFAMTVCKHVRSNSIVLAKGGAVIGIGGGQPNRVDCVKIAVERGKDRVAGSVLASDAFFPFADSVEEAAKAGVTAIAHPGGSIRDKESLAAADEHGIAMAITGKRHFLH